MLLVIDIGTNLSQICLDIYKYNSDSDIVLPPVPESVISLEKISLSVVRACATFINVTNKTKIICKKTVNKEEKIILEEWAKEMIKLL